MFTLYWIAFVPSTQKAIRPSMSSNGSRTSNISSRSGWPRGLGKLNPKPHSWIFTSVSVDSSPRSHLFTSATVRRVLVHTAQRAKCGIEPISDAPPSRSARRTFALSPLNHRSHMWTEAISGIAFVPAQLTIFQLPIIHSVCPPNFA